jgi:hypothetical protein
MAAVRSGAAGPYPVRPWAGPATKAWSSYVHFFVGPFLRETPPGKDMDYVTFWVDYTF